jgi:hypothetical protein
MVSNFGLYIFPSMTVIFLQDLDLSGRIISHFLANHCHHQDLSFGSFHLCSHIPRSQLPFDPLVLHPFLGIWFERFYLVCWKDLHPLISGFCLDASLSLDNGCPPDNFRSLTLRPWLSPSLPLSECSRSTIANLSSGVNRPYQLLD